MRTSMKLLSFVLFILFINSCTTTQRQDLTKYQNINDSIKRTYAPDKRVAIYAVEITENGSSVFLKGESDQPKAVEALKQKLNDASITFTDSIQLLPDASVGDTKYAVVNNSVANIRSQGKHSGELATQALLGMGLKVLKIQGAFYLVQTPDAYISWVDHGGVTLMNEQEYMEWNQSPKIIYTQPWGYAYQEASDRSAKVSDLVLGARLNIIDEEGGFYKISYPDKRVAFVKKTESSKYNHWLENLDPSGDLIEKYAKEFLGAPYLWGGTSTKGMDCSGFTKTVYYMNGFIIPRDASQQINAGENIDPDLKFENLKKGDLMFFGRKATDSTKQRTTHVGIWLGNDKGEFIHSSKQVRLSSIDSDSEYYDQGNTNRYLGSRRYLGIKDKMITNLKTDKVLTEIKQ